MASRTLRIEIPAAFRPLLKPARYKGAFGGRGSAKSHTFASMLIQRCLQRVTRAVCVREIQRTLEQSVKRLLEDKIKQYELGHLFRILNTHIETPGGGIIGFQGMQQHTNESIKSLEGYDVAWVEEAQMLSQRSLDLLRPTIRVENSELWFTWNPKSAADPIDGFLRSKHPPKDSIVVETTYKSNPWFSDVLKAEMEWDRVHDPEKYAHIWLGGYEEHTEARVFKNWRIASTDAEFKLLERGPKDGVYYWGGDWGFAIDPTVLVRCWFEEPRTLVVDRESYAIGCEIEDTPSLFDQIEEGMAREWEITADSARPETISYMRRHGYPRIRPAKKGAGSLEEGVKFLQNYSVLVHPSCQHTSDELTHYRYKTNALTGAVLPILQDKKNHVIDSLRYAVESLRKARPTAAAPDYQAKARVQDYNEGDPDRDHEGAIADPSGEAGAYARHSSRRARTIPSGW